MALYTVSSCISEVRRLVEEANDTNVIEENALMQLVSAGQKWVAAESGCYQAWSTLTLLADTLRYDPPSTTSGVLTLQYNYGGDIGYRDLLRVEPGQVPHAADHEYPYFWHYRGNKVSIYPAVPTLPINRTIDILVAKLPADLTALTDSLVIADEYQILVPLRVAWTVLMKDNQLEKATGIDNKLQQLMKVGIAQYSHQSGLAPSAPSGEGGGAT